MIEAFNKKKILITTNTKEELRQGNLETHETEKHKHPGDFAMTILMRKQDIKISKTAKDFLEDILTNCTLCQTCKPFN
jgi:hypothetical protein